jgi:hypothetical protein
VIQKKTRVNNYLIYHGGRKQTESVNVDSLRLFHPFKDISGRQVQPEALFPKRRAKTTKSTKTVVATVSEAADTEFIVKDQARISELTVGDLCVIKNPYNFFEPISVLRVLKWDDKGNMEGQFYGKHTFEWYIDRRLAKFPFKPAWYQPSDRKFYYNTKPMHYAHPPFTNVLAQESVFNTSNIIAFGFELQKDQKIPRAIVKLALDAWRTMNFQPAAIGEPTYEAKDDDLADLRP